MHRKLIKSLHYAVIKARPPSRGTTGSMPLLPGSEPLRRLTTLGVEQVIHWQVIRPISTAQLWDRDLHFIHARDNALIYLSRRPTKYSKKKEYYKAIYCTPIP
jgi:hypothetical protein